MNIKTEIRNLIEISRMLARTGILLALQDYVIPWYSKQKHFLQDHMHFKLRNEVASKLEEAFAPIRWVRRDEDHLDAEVFEVTKVRALITGGNYLPMLTISDADGEVGEMPLHVFLQTFEPVDEIRPHEYHS